MIEERFESYVYQIMQYVKYKENEPYIESILDNMRYTLFREDREYIKDLQQENKKLKGILQEIYERAINTNITSLDFREYILEILGGKDGEIN